MNFDSLKQNNSHEIKKENLLSVLNDFALLITLNATRLDQQALPGYEKEIREMQEVLRKPVINGMSYSDFIAQHATSLAQPHVAQPLLKYIYNSLLYIEPNLAYLKDDALWKERYQAVKAKYTALVTTP